MIINSSDNLSNKPTRLVTVKQLCALPEYPFSVQFLRYIIFQSETRIGSNGDVIKGNGLKEAGAIIRLGRKILIDLDRFDHWVTSHRDMEGAKPCSE